MRTKSCLARLTLLCLCLAISRIQAQLHKKQKHDNVLAEMQVICQSDSIVLKVNTKTPFNGMVYAKDAPSGNNCMSEYTSSTNLTFRLPLKSCGTMFAEADDGIEYFNTVIVQPHMRLMTNQGKGYHIRCKYQTRERTIANTHFNVSAAFTMQNSQQAVSTPLLATASMPSCTMKIFRSGRDDVAETVKIGDKLIMIIEIDQQDMYGMKITNCVVRDGMNVAEQQLINDAGCPIDESIMPKFEYTNNSTRAAVSFPAHKFPHTSSIYYQCNVRLCINNGGCEPIECNRTESIRSKRSPPMEHQYLAKASSLVSPTNPETNTNTMSFDVYSGLFVSDLDIGDVKSNSTSFLLRKSESSSSDSNIKQVSESERRDTKKGSSSSREVCFNFSQSGSQVILFGLLAVCVMLMLMCQLGWISNPSSTERPTRYQPRMKVERPLRLPAHA